MFEINIFDDVQRVVAFQRLHAIRNNNLSSMLEIDRTILSSKNLQTKVKINRYFVIETESKGRENYLILECGFQDLLTSNLKNN